jgi:hypothetical protein
MVAHKLKHGEMVVTIDVQWLSPVRPGAISVHDSNGMQQTFILREAAEIEMHGTVANNTDAS